MSASAFGTFAKSSPSRDARTAPPSIESSDDHPRTTPAAGNRSDDRSSVGGGSGSPADAVTAVDVVSAGSASSEGAGGSSDRVQAPARITPVRTTEAQRFTPSILAERRSFDGLRTGKVQVVGTPP